MIEQQDIETGIPDTLDDNDTYEQRLQRIEKRMDELEQRQSELEEYAAVLAQAQKAMAEVVLGLLKRAKGAETEGEVK